MSDRGEQGHIYSHILQALSYTILLTERKDSTDLRIADYRGWGSENIKIESFHRVCRGLMHSQSLLPPNNMQGGTELLTTNHLLCEKYLGDETGNFFLRI
jgi:hypothetical protein